MEIWACGPEFLGKGGGVWGLLNKSALHSMPRKKQTSNIRTHKHTQNPLIQVPLHSHSGHTASSGGLWGRVPAPTMQLSSRSNVLCVLLFLFEPGPVPKSSAAN